MPSTDLSTPASTNLVRLVSILSLVAAVIGLTSNVYHETDWAMPQMFGQDVVTALVASSLLALTLMHTPSARVELIVIGLVGYLWYTYTGAAFAYTFNEMFLLYVALFSLSSIALIRFLVELDKLELVACVDERMPVQATRIALMVFAGLLSVLWLAQIIAYLVTGKAPEGVRLGGNGFIYPYVLDLGVVVPLALVTARWLKTGSPWGYVFAGALLIKALAMGLALVAMSVATLLGGFEAPLELFAVWIIIVAGSSLMSYRFLAHVKGRAHHGLEHAYSAR